MTSPPPEPDQLAPKRKRRLRAALAADIANFSGRVSVNETRAFGNLSSILKIGREELDRHDGDLIGMPGDGLFALFESAVDAVQCALAIQQRLSEENSLGGMRLRIGIHVGDVLFEGDLPFGETLNIAARLESLADPGGILVSGTIVDAVSARISATFEDRGVPRLKNIPRRITTYAVHSAERVSDEELGGPDRAPLDKTMQIPREEKRPIASPSLQERLAAPPDPLMPRPPESPPPVHVKPSEPKPEIPVVSDVSSTVDRPLPTTAAKPALGPTASKSSSSRLPSSRINAPSPEDIAQIVDALAVHLGPVARVMVNRKARTAQSTGVLIEEVLGELKTSDERAAFRSQLLKLIGR